jgi:hypothetical protein
MRRFKRSECAILPLVLKGKWYEMIDRGEKREEYRDEKSYWHVRLVRWSDRQDFGMLLPVVEFRLGYAKRAPKMAFAVDGIECKNGFIVPYFIRGAAAYPEWGEPGTPHYVIALGERVELEDAP